MGLHAKKIKKLFMAVELKGYLDKDTLHTFPPVAMYLLIDMIRASLDTSAVEMSARVNNKQVTFGVLNKMMEEAAGRFGKGHAYCELAKYFMERNRGR